MTPFLIEAGELNQRLGDRDVFICDTRWYLGDPSRGKREYDGAHIPNAAFVDLDTELTGPPGPARHPLPDPSKFSETLRKLGINRSDTVVVYDDSTGGIAARMWWMLYSIDHPNVVVLNGGIAAWTAAGFPTTSAVRRTKPSSYRIASYWRNRADFHHVSDSIGKTTIVDARAPERFRGDVETVDRRPGHIPGAINLPYMGNVDSDGKFLGPAQLRERFASAKPGTLFYCGSGVTACHDILAMEIAGIGGGVLYDGSWSEWSANPELPAELG